MVTRASAWLAGSGSSRTYNSERGAYTGPVYMPPAVEPIQTSPAIPPEVAGIQPQAVAAQLYGHNIPMFVGGRMLIGGRICEGPWFGGTQADPTVSFVAYHALNIGNNGNAEGLTQTVATQARLHAQEVWNSSAGYIATDKLPNGKFDWRPGHYAQNPFTQSVLRFGANALAYTDGIITSWQDIPLKAFGGYVPMPSVLVEHSRYGDPADGIPRSEALNRIFEHMRFESFEYEVDVSGSEPAVMIAAQMEMEEFLKQLRALHVNWEISWKDKIRIVEPSGFVVGATLNNRNVLRNSIKFHRTDPLLVPRETRYKFWDIDRDYEGNVAVAREDLQPIPTTLATNTRSIELPFATTAAQAVADVHISHYQEQAARFGMNARVNSTLFGIEPGDGASYQEGVHDFVGSLIETAHDFGTISVDIKAVEKVRCDADVDEEPTDPHFGDVILLLDCTGEPGSTTFVDRSSFAHTVTANGNAQVSTTLFPDGALICDGTGDGLLTQSNTALATVGLSPTNTSPFTIEIRATFDAINRTQILVAIDQGAFARFFRLRQNGDDELTFDWSNTSGATFDDSLSTAGANLTAGQEYSAIVDKDSTGTLRIFINGAMFAKATPAASVIADTIASISVFSSGLLSGSSFDGQGRAVRITRNVSRYGDVTGDASFTPPTLPLPGGVP